MAVEIGKLRVLELRVEFGAADFLQEFVVAPQAASRRGFGILQVNLIAFFLRGIVLLASGTSCRNRFRCPTTSGRNRW